MGWEGWVGRGVGRVVEGVSVHVGYKFCLIPKPASIFTIERILTFNLTNPLEYPEKYPQRRYTL